MKSRFWLKIPVKVRAQLVRAGRVFAVTFGTQFLAAGEPVHWKLICAVIVSAAETVFRQFVPVVLTSPVLTEPPAVVK